MARFAYRTVVEATTPASNWSKFVAHPVADRILWLLANHTGLHPNTVTALANVLGVAAAVCFTRGDRFGYLLGAACFYFAFALDAIDGALARLTGKTSKLGAWLDTVTDFLRSQLCAACLSVGVYRSSGDLRALYVGMALMGVIAFYYYLAEVSQKVLGKRPAQLAQASSSKLPSLVRRMGIVPSPFGLPDLEGVCFVLGPALGAPFVAMGVALLLGSLTRVAAFLVVLRRLHDRATD